ncbi:hypothetical protein F5146DRAFT_1005458 [Armillaria mellea]|nr:hypothetical protein F5146DRAFT_1005458 [Armillaria mellea]
MSTAIFWGYYNFSFVVHLELTTNKVHFTLAQEDAAEMVKMAQVESQLAEQSDMTQTPLQDSPLREALSQASPQDADATIFAIQHETSLSAMILQGIELEKEQCCLRLGYTALVWFEIQQLYMPGMASLHAEWNKMQLAAKAVVAEWAVAEAASVSASVDDVPQNARKGRKPHKCHARAKPIEEALKAVNVPLFLPGETVNYRYHKLWEHLVTLAAALEGKKDGCDWQLHILNASGCEMEGQQTMSWIWHVHHHDIDAEETAEVHCWREEGILVLEEMKHVKVFFAWEGRTWLLQAGQEDISEGEHVCCKVDQKLQLRHQEVEDISGRICELDLLWEEEGQQGETSDSDIRHSKVGVHRPWHIKHIKQVHRKDKSSKGRILSMYSTCSIAPAHETAE